MLADRLTMLATGYQGHPIILLRQAHANRPTDRTGTINHVVQLSQSVSHINDRVAQYTLAAQRRGAQI